AAVEFDGENFCGTIENISDLVTFESDNAEDLEREFHAAVEDYIEFCKLTSKKTEDFATAV
ncbi:MAG: hypothetical protein IJS81_09065, partial [Selenomonadaceae bacterium]|nr:hypothetical protein [Selenomonadaceae bacterium]MBQ7630342.1 hypothetical protein [Selenomonadaceae bacterium]